MLIPRSPNPTRADELHSVPDYIPDNLKDRLKESYDAISPAYTSWTATRSPVRMRYVEKLLALLPASGEPIPVLELGSGAGIPVTERLIRSPNLAVTANDLSAAQIQLAKEKLETDRVQWVEGDMMELVFPDESLEAVLACYSIQHLPRGQQAEMLAMITRWLRPGGYLLANFPEDPSTGEVMEHWLHEKGWMYWSGWGADASLEKIKEAGLDVRVANIESDDVRARSLWVIAQK
ncbi:S-adenosyl-L-methionine-dependent methyltransferase [Thozetella sp. PMI_491]|nr:S-adenosyl-L-methionine-dependent methyltransferase [Thozetella sp. PMI_491]